MADEARDRLAADVEPWLLECGSCDYGLPTGCVCPKGDYRPILAKVWDAYLSAIGADDEQRPADDPAPTPTCDGSNCGGRHHE